MANHGFNPVQAKPTEVKILMGTFTTNGTSDPTVVSGDIASVAYDDVGDFTVTLNAAYPQAVVGIAQVLGNEPELDAKCGSFANITSGTFTLHTFDEDDTSGIAASADSTGKVVQVVLYVRNTKLTHW